MGTRGVRAGLSARGLCAGFRAVGVHLSGTPCPPQREAEPLAPQGGGRGGSPLGARWRGGGLGAGPSGLKPLGQGRP